MVHKAEIDFKLQISKKSIDRLDMKNIGKYDVVFVRLPNIDTKKYRSILSKDKFQRSELPIICNMVCRIVSNLKKGAKFLIMGDPLVMSYVHEYVRHDIKYQTWIVVRLSDDSITGKYLKNEHDGILVYSNDDGGLQHSVVRVQYEYCQSCKKTVKDYGGKKHLYHEYGTSLSDVWRDFSTSRKEKFPKHVIERIRDLFSVKPNKNMLALSMHDYQKMGIVDKNVPDSLFPKIPHNAAGRNKSIINASKLINGDCIEQLRKIKENTLDLVFVDPPYNLSKNYDKFKDKMNNEEYFAWCDTWLYELSRVLRPGGSLMILNIPSSAARHFLFLHQVLHFQNWIVWDALSTPLKKIMPAHYSILYFTKGAVPNRIRVRPDGEDTDSAAITKLNYGFCTRPRCIKARHENKMFDEAPLTDLWTDIHRIKHNSLREDHPTILPPRLLQRIISMSSDEKDFVVDCFNGVGTTTLVAEQMNRKYIGIEKSENYHKTSKKRHNDLSGGLDPFAKRKTIPLAKNSTLRRVKKRKYEVPKRVLQLEIKEIYQMLDRMPKREDVIKHSKHPIEFFDDYFRSWFEVTEAARTTGMTEYKAG